MNLKKIFNWLKQTFTISTDFLRENSTLISVEITEELKRMVRSRAAAHVVRLIPGKYDDRALELLDRAIPILIEVAQALQLLRYFPKNSEAFDAILERLKQVDPELEKEFYIQFQGRMNHRLADGRLDMREAFDSGQELFHHLYKNR